jgi:hypothetical protein
MKRYKLNDKGMNALKGFIFEHGCDDYIDEYIQESESIFSHAMHVNAPALLIVESFADDGEFFFNLEPIWFEECKND